MYKNNLKLILGVLIALLLAIVLKETDMFAKEAKAEVPCEAPMPMPTNVSYSTIYYNHHTFIVFSNASGSDIEVIQID